MRQIVFCSIFSTFCYFYHIKEVDSLHQGPYIVVPVCSSSRNYERQIDLGNIGVNCSYINGDIVGAGKTLDYNNYYGPFAPRKGYVKGPVLIETGWGLGNGGGVCQVSSTMYDLLLQLPGINMLARRSHGPSGIEYLPLDMDAAVGNEDSGINFIFRNEYSFPIRFEAQAQDGALFLAVYRVTD